MSKLARHSKALPQSLFLKDVRVIPNPIPPGHEGDVYDIDLLNPRVLNHFETDLLDAERTLQHANPVAGGGSTDIYLGQMPAKQLVAIKVIRAFGGDKKTKEAFSVCGTFC
jgi:hypothetical protein